MVMELIIITSSPMTINMLFTGRFAVSIAEKGAVKIPPMRRPRMIFQCWIPNVKMKVIAAVSVKINLATVELPTANLGVKEFLINVPVTNGPHPPPAKESINPPASPSLVRFVFLFNFLSCFCLKAFEKI